MDTTNYVVIRERGEGFRESRASSRQAGVKLYKNRFLFKLFTLYTKTENPSVYVLVHVPGFVAHATADP